MLPALRGAHADLKLYLREDLTRRLLERLRAGGLDVARGDEHAAIEPRIDEALEPRIHEPAQSIVGLLPQRRRAAPHLHGAEATGIVGRQDLGDREAVVHERRDVGSFDVQDVPGALLQTILQRRGHRSSRVQGPAPAVGRGQVGDPR